MQQYTMEQLGVEIAALQQMFDDVALIDPAAVCRLEPETLRPAGAAERVPPLDDRGRAWRPGMAGEEVTLTFYQAIRAGGRPCVLAVTSTLPRILPEDGREANAFARAVRQYRDELSHDYVTGVYNRSCLDGALHTRAEAAAEAGQKVSATLVRVNEYAEVCRREGPNAADSCLNAAAGVLQRALGAEQDSATLIRLEDGLFLVVSIGTDGAAMAHALRDALDSSRKCFNLSLARRAEFTAAVAAADWAETGNWNQMLALAEQRMQNS